jgi:hypothetical protein
MDRKQNARCTTLLLLLVWLATMAACTGTSEVPTIGICQFISHPDLDSMGTGFIQALQDAEYEDERPAHRRHLPVHFTSGFGPYAHGFRASPAGRRVRRWT